MNKIILVTHTDLDGVGCAMVADIYCQAKNIELEEHFCDYNTINLYFSELLEKMKDKKFNVGDSILITDISIGKENADKLDELYKKGYGIKLLDHHISAAWLNDIYEWVEVSEVDGNNNELLCGSYMLYEYLSIRCGYAPGSYRLRNIVELIRLYDTYQFKNARGIGMIAEDLNLFYQQYMKENNKDYRKFIQLIIKTYIFNTENDLYYSGFTDEDNQYIYKAKANQIKYIDLARKTLLTDKFRGDNIGIIWCSNYVSKVCDTLLTENPDIDYIININTEYMKLDFRTHRDNINLGKDIVPLFGGGGWSSTICWSNIKVSRYSSNVQYIIEC